MLITPVPHDYIGTYSVVTLKVRLFTKLANTSQEYDVIILEGSECIYKNYQCYDMDTDRGTHQYNVDFLIDDIYMKCGSFMFKKYSRLHFDVKDRNDEMSFKIKCCIIE